MRALPGLPVLAATFVALLAGCIFGGGPADDDGPPLGELGDDASLRVDAVLAEVNATRGQRVVVPITLGCAAPPAAAVDVRLVAPGLVGVDVGAELNASCARTVFAALDVPVNATNETRVLAVEVRDAADGRLLRRAAAEVSLRVLEPDTPGWSGNATAFILYTGRFADTGEVFFTNDPALRGQPYVRNETHHRTADRPLAMHPRETGNVPSGLLSLMRGMMPGETRSATVAPVDAYGNESVLARQARVEPIARDYLLEVETESMARESFDTHIRATGQGDPSTMEPGDAFVFSQDGNAWRYVITRIDARTVDYRFQPEEGDRYTLYPFWPGGAEVVAVTPENVAFYITPTTAVDEPFTRRAGWPMMSAIVNVTSAEVWVLHTPPVGHTYERPIAGGGTALVEVVGVTDEHVVEAYPNPHPFAGRALVFDLRLLTLDVGG